MQDIEREIAMNITETECGDIAMTKADAQTLIRLSEKHGEKYIFLVILPFVKKHTSNVNITVAFIGGLSRAGETHKLSLETIDSLFKDILGDLIPDLKIHYREVGREQRGTNSPNEGALITQAHFPVKAQLRDHLEERLRQSSCSTETIKSGTPYTLVVKKRGMEWENAMIEWKKRCGVALKVVEDIGTDKLRGLLGEGWEDAVGLAGIRRDGGEERGERLPLGKMAQGKRTGGKVETGVGDKVKGPETVDLSDE